MTYVALTKGVINPTRAQIQAQVRQTMELLGGMGNFIKKGERVLIKPNVTEDHTSDRGTTVNPFLVEALVDLCQAAGAGEIIIGEGSGVGKDTLECLELTGWSFFQERGIKLVDLNKEEAISVPVPEGLVFKEMKVAKLAREVDAIINVPVLKTHMATLLTGCLKNLKGLIPPVMKKAFHFHGLEGGIVDLNTVMKPRLHFMDILVAQEGLGPVAGTPLPLGMMLAGSDPVAIDSVGAHLMGIGSHEVKHLTQAAGKGLGEIDLSHIKVVGEDLASCVRPFQRPNLELEFAGVQIQSDKGCSGCNMPIMMSLRRLEATGELQQLREKYGQLQILFGKEGNITDSGTAICFGICQQKQKDKATLYVEGCPPASWYIRDKIRSQLLGLETLVDPGPTEGKVV